MTEYPIKIRIGSANAGDYETQTYTDSTFNEAVLALQGTHPVEAGYHQDTSVYVVATHAETVTVEGDGRRTRTVTYKAGEPVFGYEAQVYGRGQRWGTGNSKDAQPSWSSKSTGSTDEARLMLAIYDLAVRLAEAANTHPRCTGCIAEETERNERYARIEAESKAKDAEHDAIHNGSLAAHDGYAPHLHPAGGRDHSKVLCECDHPTHLGKVCRECSKSTPRGMHGTPARCGLTQKAGAR
jgi:hypothetical protein